MDLRTASKYLLILIVIFIGLQVCSQTDECLTRTTVVTVAGHGTKDAAKPIVSLTTEGLQVKVAGKTVAVGGVAPPSTPLRVGIVLDVGSSQTKSTWDSTRLMLHNFQSQLPEGTEFSLVTFDDKVEQKVPLSAEASAFHDTLAAASPTKIKESKAGLYEAIATGIRAFDSPHPGDALLVITAWEDGGGSDMQAAVSQWLSVAGVRLFGISFDSSRLPAAPPTATFATTTIFAPIEAVSKSAGGLWVRTATGTIGTDTLPKMYAVFMSDFYVVTLKLTQRITKPQDLRIELVKGNVVTFQANLSRKDVLLYYPPSLYPCH